MVVCCSAYQEGKEAGVETGGRGTDEQPLSDNPLLYDVEKLTGLGISNLNLIFCVKKMKEKCVTFCFIKLNAKISPKSWGKG